MKKENNINSVSVLLESLDLLKKFDTLSGRKQVDEKKIELFKSYIHDLIEIRTQISELNNRLEQMNIDDLNRLEDILIDLYRQYYTISATMAEISEEIRQIFLFIKSMKDLN